MTYTMQRTGQGHVQCFWNFGSRKIPNILKEECAPLLTLFLCLFLSLSFLSLSLTHYLIARMIQRQRRIRVGWCKMAWFQTHPHTVQHRLRVSWWSFLFRITPEAAPEIPASTYVTLVFSCNETRATFTIQTIN